MDSSETFPRRATIRKQPHKEDTAQSLYLLLSFFSHECLQISFPTRNHLIFPTTTCTCSFIMPKPCILIAYTHAGADDRSSGFGSATPILACTRNRSRLILEHNNPDSIDLFQIVVANLSACFLSSRKIEALC